MLKQRLIEEVTAKLSEVLAASPARDLEKNLKATLTALFAKLDLVTREEFDVQAQVLARTHEKLAELETRLSRLEAGAEAAQPEGGEGSEAVATETESQPKAE